MPILLQRFERLAQRAWFDPDSGELIEAVNPAGTVAGLYSMISGTTWAVYRSMDGALVLALGAARVPFSDITTVNIEPTPDGTTRLRLATRRGDVYENKYRRSPEHILNGDDPTPFVDEDDFDIGLYIQNLVRNPHRQRLVFSDG